MPKFLSSCQIQRSSGRLVWESSCRSPKPGFDSHSLALPHPSELEMGIPSFSPGKPLAGSSNTGYYRALFGQSRNWCGLGTNWRGLGINWLSRPATTRSGYLAPRCHWNFFLVAQLSSWQRWLSKGIKGMGAGLAYPLADAKDLREESCFRSTGEIGPVWGRAKERSKHPQRDATGCPGDLGVSIQHFRGRNLLPGKAVSISPCPWTHAAEDIW